jgi:hypothetical protein
MKFADLLKQNTSSTNTATLTLTSAVTGFRTLTQVIAENELAVGDRTTFMVRDTLGNWEFSLFEIVSPGTLTRVEVRGSSNAGSAETFPSGAVATNMPDSKWLSELVSIADAVEVIDLPALTTVTDAVRILGISTAGELGTIAASLLKSYTGGAAGPADSTVPSAPTNLASSSVTQTSFTVSFTAGTDNVGVQRHEWSLDGTSWTQIASGNTFNVTGRTAGTTYTVRVRTVDTSGNVSTVATVNVTTAAASSEPDTQAPTWLAGSLSTSAVTTSGYSMTWPTATDNVGVDHYESSIDGGATWTVHAANVTSRTVTGRPASTTDQLRLRAHDAAGNISNVLTATVTTSAVAPNPYTARVTTAQGVAISGATWTPSTTAVWQGASGDRYASAGSSIRVQVLDGSGNAAPNVKFVWARVDGSGNPIRSAGMSYDSTTLAAGATGNTNAVASGLANASRYGSWTAGGATSQQYYGVFGISGSLFAWRSATGLAAESRCLEIWIEGQADPIYYTNGTGTPLLFNIAMP